MKDRIKQLRKSLKMTQAAFAKSLDLSKPTIEAYEYGRLQLNDRMINHICREFNVNSEWLRTGTGDMFNPSPANDATDIIKEMLLPSDSAFIKLVSALSKRYIQLDPERRKVVDQFISDTLQDLADHK